MGPCPCKVICVIDVIVRVLVITVEAVIVVHVFEHFVYLPINNNIAEQGHENDHGYKVYKRIHKPVHD